MCGGKSEGKYSFCPHCGNDLRNTLKERDDFGLLGKNDFSDYEQEDPYATQGIGVMDKLVSSMFNSMMKNLDKQFKNQFKGMDEQDFGRTEVRGFPNGIRIK